MLWDVFLQVLGIFFTVVILQRYFEHREEMRWHPARQCLYQQLFIDADWLLGLLPGYQLRSWLAERAEEVEPFDPGPLYPA